jgi:predicted outer membrane protein
MRNALTLAAALLLVSASAFAQSAGEKTGINSALGISPSTADFVKEVAMSDMTEIAASKIGQERGNAEEKAFASQMITDHTKTSGELKQLVSSGDVKAEIPARSTVHLKAKWTSSRTRSRTTFRRPSIRCRSAPTRTRSRCSNATPREATIRN